MKIKNIVRSLTVIGTLLLSCYAFSNTNWTNTVNVQNNDPDIVSVRCYFVYTEDINHQKHLYRTKPKNTDGMEQGQRLQALSFQGKFENSNFAPPTPPGTVIHYYANAAYCKATVGLPPYQPDAPSYCADILSLPNMQGSTSLLTLAKIGHTHQWRYDQDPGCSAYNENLKKYQLS